MNTERENQTWYQKTFDEVHASEHLLRKVEAMENKDYRQTFKKKLHMGYAAAAAVAVLVFSNVISYASSGSPWILTVTLPDGETRQVEMDSSGEDGTVSYTYENVKKDSAITANMESAETDAPSDEAVKADITYSTLEVKDGRTYLIIDNEHRVDITEDFKDGVCKGSVKAGEGDQYWCYEVTGTPEDYDIQVELVEVTIK